MARRELDLWRYVADMRLIQQSWANHQIGRVLELLDAWRPELTEGIDYRGFEWHYWLRLCNDQIATLPNSSGASCGAWSHNGQFLAAGIGDRIVVWDGADLQERLTLHGCVSSVDRVVFSHDGEIIAALDSEGAISLWDTRDGRLLRQFQTKRAAYHKPPFALSPDGKLIVGNNGTSESPECLTVWDVESGSAICKLSGNGGTVLAAAFGPDSTILAVGTDQGVLTLWNVPDWSELRRLTKEEGGCGGRDRVACVVFSPDGRRLASVSYRVDVWDVTTGEHLFEAAKATEGSVQEVSFSPDGQHLAGAIRWCDQPAVLEIWDMEDGAAIGMIKGPRAEIKSVAYDATGRQVASIGEDGVKLWSVEEWVEQGGIRYRNCCGGMGVAFSPDGRLVTATDWGDGELLVYETATGKPVLRFTHGFNDAVVSVAFSPDGRLLAAGGGEWFTRPGELKVWDLASGQLVHDFKGHEVALSSIAFSPDGRRLAARDCLNTDWRIWDLATGQCLLRGPTCDQFAAKGGIAFSPDGKRIALGRGGDVQVCDASTAEILLTLPSPDHFVVSGVVFSPDGRSLAAAAGKTVPVWNAATGQVQHLLKGHPRYTCDVSFAPDGRRLATACDDVIKIWDLETGQELLTLDQSGCVAFSPDGRRLATGGFIWDTARLQLTNR